MTPNAAFVKLAGVLFCGDTPNAFPTNKPNGPGVAELAFNGLTAPFATGGTGIPFASILLIASCIF